MSKILSPEDLIMGRSYTFLLGDGFEVKQISATFGGIDREFKVDHYGLVIKISYMIYLEKGKKKVVNSFIFWKRIRGIQEI